jgi:hypothetical protein
LLSSCSWFLLPLRLLDLPLVVVVVVVVVECILHCVSSTLQSWKHDKQFSKHLLVGGWSQHDFVLLLPISFFSEWSTINPGGQTGGTSIFDVSELRVLTTWHRSRG